MTLEEAMKWADQPLDRVIDRDRAALEAIHTLAAVVKAMEKNEQVLRELVDAYQSSFSNLITKINDDVSRGGDFYSNGYNAALKKMCAWLVIEAMSWQKKLDVMKTRVDGKALSGGGS